MASLVRYPEKSISCVEKLEHHPYDAERPSSPLLPAGPIPVHLDPDRYSPYPPALGERPSPAPFDVPPAPCVPILDRPSYLA